MGFSYVAAAAVIGVSILVATEILLGGILPTLKEFNNSYDDMKDRAIDQVQTEINITGVSETQAFLNWWNTEWEYRKLITINSSQVDDALTNFPVLISQSSDTDLADHAQSNGNDIVFILFSDNTTQLNHEIEDYTSYDTIPPALPYVSFAIWVNVTSISSTSDTKIWVYYGNSTCGSQENVAGTWDSDYVMVLHLSENCGSNDCLQDSTSNNNDGTPYTSELGTGSLYSNNGVIDAAVDMDGNDDRVKIDDANSLDGYGTMTWEAWWKPNDIQNCRALMSKRNAWSGIPAQNSYAGGFVVSTPNHFNWEISSTGSGGVVNKWSNTEFSEGHWNHVVVTFDRNAATDVELYVNSSLKNHELTQNLNNNIFSGSAELKLGCVNSGNECDMDGSIDEVRISKITRGTAWITASYNSMSSPSTFFTLGSEQDRTQVYLNITVENTGSTNLEAGEFTLLINGTEYQFSSSKTYLYPVKITYLTTTDLVDSGAKRVKVISNNGASDYYSHAG